MPSEGASIPEKILPTGLPSSANDTAPSVSGDLYSMACLMISIKQLQSYGTSRVDTWIMPSINKRVGLGLGWTQISEIRRTNSKT